jgi:hypothetical protein
MTIAAGFKVDAGIVLCSDSQYVGGAKVNQPKLFGYRHGDSTGSIALVFALAGHEINGKIAIDECVDAMTSCNVKELTARKAWRVLRQTINVIYQECVDSRSVAAEKESAKFELVVGCWLPYGGGFQLFRTSGPGVVKGDDYYCVGIGAYLGDYLMRSAYVSSMPIQKVAILAIQALAAIKAYDANCGGESQFMVLYPDGIISPRIEYNINVIEARIGEFESLSRKLLFRLADTQSGLKALAMPDSSDSWFESDLAAFVADIRRLRASWRGQGLEHLLKIIEEVKAEAILNPKPTTGDQLSQPPSPE